ncbi:MAG: DNA mismatch repair protein MutS, partial [Synechococcaceae cyanobacterium]|nr:DNA mismatch repair protein MutS [Synechococcaceae cyanobacterium]
MAAPTSQQLSLVGGDTLQGDLFSGSEATAPGTAAAAETGETDILAAAAARPRRRRAATAAPAATPPAPLPEGACAEAAEATPERSGEPGPEALPAWHHHSLVDPQLLTPMLRHYVELKREHPDRVLLYRLGDFFEVFFEDAILLSRTLELTLTGKEGGRQIGRVPMAGIPHHAAERHCAELVRQGLSVALCDQLEPAAAKGALLRREITRVITPGTVLEEGMLSARRNNWLCAVVLQENRWGLAVADVSTGEFRVTERERGASLHQELLQLEPSELLLPATAPKGADDAPPPPDWCPQGLRLSSVTRTPFETAEARACLLARFGLASLAGLGLAEAPLALRAAGGLVAYLDATQPGADDHCRVPLDRPRLWQAGDQLVLDAQTRRNLELTRTQLGGSLQGSLLWALDRSATAMGGRCLRRWLEAPLLDPAAIGERQDGIGELVEQRSLRLGLRRLLRPMGDLERLAGRAGAGSASARDLVSLADGIERLPQLAALVRGCASAPLRQLQQPWPDLHTLAARIRHLLVEAPPLNLSEGGLIHDGVDERLDGMRNQLEDQEQWLAKQEAQERQASGNANLRLQYHRTFGYFLSVSRARAQTVPDHWIRRQTLANEERFITPEIKAREGRILQLRNRAAQREYELFCLLRGEVGEQAAAIRAAARLVAELDCLASLAEVAAAGHWCRPQLEEGRRLQIEAGRHPVVEQLLVEQRFTANSIALGDGGGEAPDLLVLTGPNASGKSCYLRQTGLLQLLAQTGSWLPARSARLGIADRIFTRVGAVDDLASGQSTFMVEMAETANILHHASDRSLVLLDEIGR